MTDSLWEKSYGFRIIFLICIFILSIISLIICSKSLSNCYLDNLSKVSIINPKKWLIYAGSYGIISSVVVIICQCIDKNVRDVIQILYIAFFEIWGIFGSILYLSVRKCTIYDNLIIMLLVNIIVFVIANCIIIIWLIYLSFTPDHTYIRHYQSSIDLEVLVD